MSAFLKKTEKVDVVLKDFNVEAVLVQKFDHDSFYSFAMEVLSQLDFNPDIVGISCLFSTSFYNFIESGKAVRKIFPKAILVGGGNIPTSAFLDFYTGENADIFDAFCFGEGELPMRDLVRAPDKISYLQSAQAKSWITKKKIENCFSPQHDFIEDLDEIPFFDYELCDINHYNTYPGMRPPSALNNKLSFNFITSRGCPFHCTYCASHVVHGRKVRAHSEELGGRDEKVAECRRKYQEYAATPFWKKYVEMFSLPLQEKCDPS